MSYNPNTQSQLSDSARVYKISAVNGLITGSNLIFTTELNKGRFIVTAVKFLNKSLTGIPIGAVIFNIGWTSSSYNDEVNAQTVTPTNTLNKVYTIATNYLSIPENTEVYLNITTAITGASEFTFDVYCNGYYEDAGIILSENENT